MGGELFYLLFRLAVWIALEIAAGLEYLYKLLIAPIVIGITRPLREARARHRAQFWILQTGTVEWVKSEDVHTGFLAELSYSYRAQGIFNSGYKRIKFSRERDLDAFTSRHQPGSHLRIRYDQDHPDRSVVLGSEQIQ